jgi:hypothetical protein
MFNCLTARLNAGCAIFNRLAPRESLILPRQLEESSEDDTVMAMAVTVMLHQYRADSKSYFLFKPGRVKVAVS